MNLLHFANPARTRFPLWANIRYIDVNQDCEIWKDLRVNDMKIKKGRAKTQWHTKRDETSIL